MPTNQAKPRRVPAARARALSLVLLGVLLGAAVSARAATLLDGLYVFVAGEPARASEINHNFTQLAQADAAADERHGALEARVAALEASLHELPVTFAQGARLDVPKGQTRLGTATCPQGTRPIAGFTRASHPYCSAVQEEYVEGNSWKVSVGQLFCRESYHGGISVDLWAVCIPAP